jgi:capsular polysaccharide biosynthesis protein/Mrp family chromosome partitioning ATPase
MMKGKGQSEGSSVQSSDSALRQYLRTVQRQAWLVVLVPALVTAAMFAVTKTQDPIYRASMTLLVGKQEIKGQPELGDNSLTRNMTALLESDYITRTTIRDLRLDMSAESFKERLSVDVLPETSVLDVSYDSTDPELALNVIREIRRIYPRRLNQTLGTRRPGQRRAIGSFDLVVRIFDVPHVQADPVGPKTGTNLIFGVIAGLALGLLLAVAREALDSRIRERKEAEEWFGAPIVGTLPKGMTSGPPPGVGSPRGGAGEARRTASLDLLRARLEFSQGGIHGPTILVADSGPDTGKSAVAANLGAALARAGRKVVLVDADVRRPRLHRSLGLNTPPDTPGLVDVLAGQIELDDALIQVEVAQPGANGAGPDELPGRLELLTGGSAPAPIGESFTPEIVSDLIKRLLDRADYVIFDSPPLVVAEAYPLAVQSDNVLVVARRGRTTKDQAEWVRAMLDELGVEKVGVVITDSPPA